MKTVKETMFALVAACLATMFFVIGVVMLFDPAATVAGYMIIALAAVANGNALMILEKKNCN